MAGSQRNDKSIIEESVPAGTNDASLKDIPLIVLSDDDSDVPLTKKRCKLTKNGNFVNNIDMNFVSSEDDKILTKYDINNLEYGSIKDQMEDIDDEFPKYKINLKDNKKLPLVTNMPTLSLNKEPSDDYVHESDEDSPIRFSRTNNKKPDTIIKTPRMRLIDEPTDDEFDNSQQTYMKDEFSDIFDDEANEDFEGEDLLGEPTNDFPHLDDLDDATHDDYDLSDSFIDDGPQPDDSTEGENESHNDSDNYGSE